MQVIWEITDEDVTKVRSFLAAKEKNRFVQARQCKNITNPAAPFSKDQFWYWMLACLLSTQQRSGPDSSISRLLIANPFLLTYPVCHSSTQVEALLLDTLKASGGIRRSSTIASEATRNLAWLEGGNWELVEAKIAPLRGANDPAGERQAARYLAENLVGFGPKQARNLLQSLGLTKYEIPLDSRITKWLKDFGFPVLLSGQALSDPDIYEFALDGLQTLCHRCGAYPCILDAAIFTSFDGDGWDEAKAIW